MSSVGKQGAEPAAAAHRTKLAESGPGEALGGTFG